MHEISKENLYVDIGVKGLNGICRIRGLHAASAGDGLPTELSKPHVGNWGIKKRGMQDYTPTLVSCKQLTTTLWR